MQYSLSDLTQSAINAHNWNSFSPEKRGAEMIRGFEQELNECIEKIFSAAKDGGAPPESEAQRFAEKYRSHVTGLISAKGRTASAMITGPARFPTEKNRRALATEQSKWDAFSEWKGKAIRAAIKAVQPEANELEQARRNLENRIKAHETMKAVNKLIRSGATVQAISERLNMPIEKAAELLQPDFAGRIGFPSYSLTNNLAEIKRLKDRVETLESKEQKAETVGVEVLQKFEGGEILLDHTADRVKIIHDEKPGAEVIGKLRAAAFKWSPSGKCWQRKITPAAIFAARKFAVN